MILRRQGLHRADFDEKGFVLIASELSQTTSPLVFTLFAGSTLLVCGGLPLQKSLTDYGIIGFVTPLF
jgi:hypothetical protein